MKLMDKYNKPKIFYHVQDNSLQEFEFGFRVLKLNLKAQIKKLKMLSLKN